MSADELPLPGSCLDCGEPWCEVHGVHYADCQCEGDELQCPKCENWWDAEDGDQCPYGCGVAGQPWSDTLRRLWAENDARLDE